MSADGSELYVANEAGWVNQWDLGTGERAASVPLSRAAGSGWR